MSKYNAPFTPKMSWNGWEIIQWFHLEAECLLSWVEAKMGQWELGHVDGEDFSWTLSNPHAFDNLTPWRMNLIQQHHVLELVPQTEPHTPTQTHWTKSWVLTCPGRICVFGAVREQLLGNLAWSMWTRASRLHQQFFGSYRIIFPKVLELEGLGFQKTFSLCS